MAKDQIRTRFCMIIIGDSYFLEPRKIHDYTKRLVAPDIEQLLQ